MRRWNASRAGLGIQTVGEWLAQGVNATTRPRTRFEKRHIMSDLSQPQGRRQPCDAGAENDDPAPGRRTSFVSSQQRPQGEPAAGDAGELDELSAVDEARRRTSRFERRRRERYSEGDKPRTGFAIARSRPSAAGRWQQVDAVDSRVRNPRSDCCDSLLSRLRPAAGGLLRAKRSRFALLYRPGRILLHVSVSTSSPLCR